MCHFSFDYLPTAPTTVYITKEVQCNVVVVGFVYKNPSIYNIIRWVAWSMGQMNHFPSV